MAKKKTFEEYTQEALYEIEKTEAALKQAKLEKEQAEHRIQRSLNYLDTQKKKKRKARTHLLIQKGAAIEAICKDTKYLTEAEFYQLMDELLHDPACKFCDVVHEMVRGRAETAESSYAHHGAHPPFTGRWYLGTKTKKGSSINTGWTDGFESERTTGISGGTYNGLEQERNLGRIEKCLGENV